MLTKEDIQAIKKCDRAVLVIDRNKGSIRLIKELKGSDVFTCNNTAEYEIDGLSGTIHTLGMNGNKATHLAASAYIGFCDYGGWNALRLIVRAGDELKLIARENNNQYVSGVSMGKTDSGEFYDLHHDEFLISIYRKGKEILRELELEDSTCPNNSARMLK